MDLFRRKNQSAAPLPLRVLPWNEVRLLDPDMGEAEFGAGMALAQAASAALEQADRTLDRPDVDALLRTLIPGLMPLGGFPDDPDRVALDFVLGWAVADAETAHGLACDRSISKPAVMALSVLRMTPDGEPPAAPATWRFLDLGYCCNRLALNPDEAYRAVTAPKGWLSHGNSGDPT